MIIEKRRQLLEHLEAMSDFLVDIVFIRKNYTNYFRIPKLVENEVPALGSTIEVLGL